MPKVGPKGQVVISKEIRDELGIKPGWIATEHIIDGRVHIYFRPPVAGDSRKEASDALIPSSVKDADQDDLRAAASDARSRQEPAPPNE